MLMTRVGLRGFRGQNRDLALTSSNVLLQGAIGAGKTSLLLGLAMLAGLPTALGAKNLELLSPTRAWAIEADIAGQGFSWQYDEKAGSVYMNGPVGHLTPCKGDRFMSNMRRFLDLEHHHIDLGAFAELSGPKRAALFAAILSGDPVTLDQAIAEGAGMTASELAIRVAGADADCAVYPQLPPALPGPLAQSASEWLTKLQGQARDAAKEAGAAVRDEAAAPGDPVALRTQLAEIDQSIGGVKTELTSIESSARAYKGAAKAVADQEAAERNVGSSLEAARRTEKLIPSMEEELEKLSGAQPGKPCDIQTLRDLADELSRLGIPRNLLPILGPALDQLETEARRDRSESPIDSVAFGNADGRIEAAAKIREVWSIIMDDAWVTFERGVMSNVVAVIESKIRKETERASAPSARAIDDKKRALGLARENVARIPEFERSQREASDRLLEMRTNLQGMAAPGDPAILKEKLVGLETARRTVSGSIAAAEQAKAALARVQAAKLNALKLDTQVRIGKAVVEAVNTYRDAQTSARIQVVTQPMTEKLTRMFGRDIGVDFHLDGEGRALKADVMVRIKDTAVRFQDLSGGESMLVAAAFLATLQELKGTPGKMLLLEADCLDAPSLAAFLERAPALGLDLLMVATNRDVTAGDTWQTIKL